MTEQKDIMENLLQPDNREVKNDLDVLKELFKKKEIESKTELNIQQIILINQKRTISELLDFKSLNDCLDDFMVLMVSHQRKGRGEFVEGFKSGREEEVKKSGGLFNIRDRLGLNK